MYINTISYINVNINTVVCKVNSNTIIFALVNIKTEFFYVHFKFTKREKKRFLT